MNVLFLNHKIKNCGVYQYGVRLFEILQKDIEINYIYVEVSSYEEYIWAIIENNDSNLSAIIYNYHSSTMTWLNSTSIQKRIKNIGIPHESPNNYFDIVCDIDPNAPENFINKVSLPRPIYENVEELIKIPTENKDIENFINMYTDSNIPIFGSFGFGFDNKGFDKIVKLVNEQYDRAIIKFVIPIAHYDPNPNTIHKARESCIRCNTKPNIKLIICHDFFSTSDILKFLKSNTINIFMYDMMHGRGISSAIDYAISVKKPIGISNSYMFRNIYSDKICVYKVPIKECFANSENYLQEFYIKYSNKNILSVFKKILL